MENLNPYDKTQSQIASYYLYFSSTMTPSSEFPSPLLALIILISISPILVGVVSGQDSGLVNTSVGSGSSSPVGDSSPSGQLAYVGAFDHRGAIAYGMGTMGMTNKLTSYLTQIDDGSIEKSRQAATFSFGSDLLKIKDTSSLTGIDSLGNEITTTYERSVTFKNCELPFMMISDDLTKLSAQGIDVDGTYSKTYILLPDIYTEDQINTFREAFKDSGATSIKTFKYDSNIDEMLGSIDLDLNKYFGSFPWSDTFSLFKNKKFMDWMLREMRNYSSQKPQPQIDTDPLWASWSEQSGSVVYCNRHSIVV